MEEVGVGIPMGVPLPLLTTEMSGTHEIGFSILS